MRKHALQLFIGLLLFSVTVIWAEEVVRKEVVVPKVDPAAIVIDGVMDEAEWEGAAHADLITSTGYEIWDNIYLRDGLLEPDYDEWYARMLWSKDTLFVFIHIDEFVNDSTNLYWNGKWISDQLFVSLSSRLGVDMGSGYDGNVYAAPEGPYHFLVLGDQVTLNNGEWTYVPDEWRPVPTDTFAQFNAADISRWATVIDTTTGLWNVEMAIYNPNVSAQGMVAFNLGGSTASRQSVEAYGDAYAYYCWQPNVPDEPFSAPATGDPGGYNLINSDYWAILNMVGEDTGVERPDHQEGLPSQFDLAQNYPNPFNPMTHIRFDVAKQGPVTLRVFNLAGQTVATLIGNRIMSEGTYSLDWDAASLPSGVYFCRLEAGGTVQMRKMTLLK